MLRVVRVLAAVLLLVGVGAVPAWGDQVRDDAAAVLGALSVPRAWGSTRGAGVTVAVLDSGVDGEQADLAGAVTQGPDLTEGANPPGVAPRRVHGTSMASIIAGRGHGPTGAEGMVGVAPEARVLAVRVILERDEPGFAAFTGDRRYESTIARGIRHAVAHGADVINLSLGRSYPTRAEREAVAYAIGRGVVVVAAAGNGGADATVRKARGGTFTYPASFPGVISVAAVDGQGRHAGFSNRNSAVSVSAPGVRIVGAGPGGQYWVGDGTSPATAFVSGVAALVRARHPKLPPALVAQAITRGARERPAGGYDLGVGFGRVDAWGALAVADRIAANRADGAGLAPGRRFAAGEAPATRVVHRSPGLIIVSLVASAAALLGLAFAALSLTRRRGAARQWPDGPR